MVNPQDLIDIAIQLADGLGGERRGRPRQTELRRAVRRIEHWTTIAPRVDVPI